MTFSKILIIIQRSNGDVFFSNTLIDQLRKAYKPTQIDLLVNVSLLEAVINELKSEVRAIVPAELGNVISNIPNEPAPST